MAVRKKSRHFGYSTEIALGFMVMILVGALLLMTPLASRSGHVTPFLDCLFTATSASCVTGLIPFDTATNWTMFGQIVIIVMIQIGGLGFVTISMIFAFAFHRKIGLRTRTLLKESGNMLYIGGIVSLARKALQRTLFFEAAGAALLCIRFIPEMGLGTGIYYGIFHSISAFCNAGFDLMGTWYGPGTSLIHYQTDPLVSLTICALIIIGGIGFFVWDDIAANGLHFHRYRLHTKVVLTATFILIIGGTVLFLILENGNLFAGRTPGQKLLMAFFQSVTPRTAGFNSVDESSLTEGSKLVTMLLMFVGGSPGSTAGGIKTTTFVLMMLIVGYAATNDSQCHIFGRRVNVETLRKAASFFVLNLSLVTIGTLLICSMSTFSLSDAFFEAFSAMGTVGLTLGISGSGNQAALVILTMLMYLGRVGGLSFALAFTEKRQPRQLEYPEEPIIIG